MTPEEAKQIVDNYNTVVKNFEGSQVQGMDGKDFINQHYLFNEAEKKKLEEARKILADIGNDKVELKQ